MRLIRPSYEILTDVNGLEMLKQIERAGRTCYKSEDKITDDSCVKFVKNILKRRHLSVIEHVNLSVKFIVDRGVTHELVRHRLCAFSQESTRYCNYKDEVTFIIPPWVNIKPDIYTKITPTRQLNQADMMWLWNMLDAEQCYCSLLSAHKWSPQQARSVLPNSLKTEIICTANLREWRHILSLRTSTNAHPQMREVMIPLLLDLRKQIPVIFDKDIGGWHDLSSTQSLQCGLDTITQKQRDDKLDKFVEFIRKS